MSNVTGNWFSWFSDNIERYRDRFYAVWSLLTLYASVVAVVILLVDLVLRPGAEWQALIFFVDTTICFFFFCDFLLLLKRAPDKHAYMLTWGIFDLLSCVPMIEPFRAFRIFRIFRLVRAFRVLRNGAAAAVRLDGALLSVVFTFVSVWFLGAFFLLLFEHDVPNATIISASDALWCALVTLATVGYGDYTPVTSAGRIVAGVLMTVGVSAFGVFTGCIASYFTLRSQTHHQRAGAVYRELELQQEVTQVRRDIEEMKQLLLDAKKSDKSGES